MKQIFNSLYNAIKLAISGVLWLLFTIVALTGTSASVVVFIWTWYSTHAAYPIIGTILGWIPAMVVGGVLFGFVALLCAPLVSWINKLKKPIS